MKATVQECGLIYAGQKSDRITGGEQHVEKQRGVSILKAINHR